MVNVRVVVVSGRAKGIQRWVHEKEIVWFAPIVIEVMIRNVDVYATSLRIASRF